MNGPMTLMLIIGISAELIEKLISSAPGNHYPGEDAQVTPEYQVRRSSCCRSLFTDNDSHDH